MNNILLNYTSAFTATGVAFGIRSFPFSDLNILRTAPTVVHSARTRFKRCRRCRWILENVQSPTKSCARDLA